MSTMSACAVPVVDRTPSAASDAVAAAVVLPQRLTGASDLIGIRNLLGCADTESVIRRPYRQTPFDVRWVGEVTSDTRFDSSVDSEDPLAYRGIFGISPISPKIRCLR